MLGRIFWIFVLIALGIGGWLAYELDRFAGTPLALPQDGAVYLLESGTSLRTLADDLERRGWIDNRYYLRLLARMEDKGHRIKAGEYRLEAGIRPLGLIDLFVSGKVISHRLTLVEGWTFREMLDAIAASDPLVHTLAGLTDGQIMERLGHPGEHPEGRFLADTYHFPRGTTDLDLLQRTYTAMQGFLDQEWQRRAQDLPFQDPYEALILASIVEKETGLAEERPQIAGVFVRRLRRGMLLQTDPTVIYGIGASFDGNLRRADLQRDTPYNTYTRAGLTPTPICMPGRDAILAALHPVDGDALYFVARGDGGHQFSASLEEHNRAVRRYQLKAD